MIDPSGSHQDGFDAFQLEYNDDRPHEALGQRPPCQFYTASPRPFPSRLPEPEYPTSHQVVTIGGGSYLRLGRSSFFISTALRGERVGFIEVEEGCFEVYFCKLLLGRIHIAHPELGLVAA